MSDSRSCFFVVVFFLFLFFVEAEGIFWPEAIVRKGNTMSHTVEGSTAKWSHNHSNRALNLMEQEWK